MLEIYGFLRDPFAWRVRFAAEEKGVPYQWLPGDCSFPDPRTVKNNPTARSPLAVHDGFVITGAFTIQTYIDEAFPGRALQPDSPRGRAETRMFEDFLEALVQILASRQDKNVFNKKAFKRLDDAFAKLDGELKSSGKPWLDGDAPGLRDISLLPLLSDLESQETSFPDSLEALLAYWNRAIEYAPFVKTNYKNAPIQGQR